MPRILLGFLIIYTVWGSTYLAIKHVVQTMPPYLAAGTRFVLAGMILYPLMRWRTGHRPSAAEWKGHALVGGLMLVIGNGLVCWAEQWIPSGIAALTIATSPMWFVLVDCLIYRGRKPGLAIVVGMGFGLLGVFQLTRGGGGESGGSLPVMPMLALIGATIGWALGSVHSKRRPQPTPVLQGVAMQMLAGGAAQLVVGTLLGEWGSVSVEAISMKSVIALAYLVFIGSLIAYTTYVWLMQVASPAAVSTYAYVNPMVAVLLGWAVDGEEISGDILTAMAIILGAVVLITWVGRPATKKGEKTPARLADERQPEPMEPN